MLEEFLVLCELSKQEATMLFYVFLALEMTLMVLGNEDLMVTLSQGQLIGTELVNKITNDTYFGYLGVPFAKPPVGEKRFKDPEDPLPWNGILKANKESNSCMTYNLLFKLAEGSEDCLYLHIYATKTPKELQDSPQPVVVWIHGGAFLFGSGRPSDYGPDFFMMHDVILVSINYRLNVFGFLSVQNDNVPGNAGLKDQVQALKWIKENIRAFGGDPDKVTILGESAGGASVHYLMMSPSAKGLFHRAIAQSGVSLNPWAFTSYSAEIAKKIGEVFDCNTENSYELVDCLQQVKANDLVAYQFNILTLKTNEFLSKTFTLPCIEPKTTKRGFLTEHPKQVMEEGNFNDVPFLLGSVRFETLLLDKLFSEESIPNSLRTLIVGQMNKNPQFLLPRNLIFENIENEKRAGQKLKEFYFLGQPISNLTVDNLINATTDTWFLLGVHDTALMHAKYGKSPVYYYQFTLETNFGESLKPLTVNKPGPSHADDLKYFFYIWEKNIEIKPEELEKVLEVESLWINFIKYGNPTPENNTLNFTWKPLTVEEQSYLEIGKEFTMKTFVEKERMEFWEKLFKEENITYYIKKEPSTNLTNPIINEDKEK